MTRMNARISKSAARQLGGSRAAGVAGCKFALLLASLVTVGCQGDPTSAGVAGSPGAGGTPGNGGGGPGAAGTGGGATTCNAPSPGASPIRRLTRFEVNNTLSDLLFDTTNAGDALPPELKGNGFNNDAASLTTSRVLVDGYHDVALTLAKRVTSDAAALANLSPCDVASQGEEACAKSFITDFGRKAFRRALSEAESASFFKIYQAGKEGTGHADGLRAVIEMALQSPQFLYRIEHGVAVPGQSVLRPTSTEMATRLSYLLWGSMPNVALLDLAAANQLETKEQIAAQAKVMLDDPKARNVLRFFTNTLYGIGGLDGLDRSTELFPTYDRSLGPLFRQETERFIEHVVWEGAGDFATLFNASYTFVNGPLAAFYGLSDVTGPEFRLVERDPTRRLGLLTHAGILASTTPGSRNNPVVRGKFIYEELFCGEVPSPPASLNVKEPPADPTRTTRERFIAHRDMDACRGCHTMLDPIGFGLENFDGVGLWRDTENGKPIDASGEIPTVDVAGPFNGPVELAKKIASSQTAQHCFADKWLAFAYGRVMSAGDACTRAQLENGFRDSGGNVKALLLAATQTDAFLYLPAPTP